MITVKYQTPGKTEINTYAGEVEGTTDDNITVQVVSKNGQPLPPIKGKPQYRSFARVHITDMRDSLGRQIARDAML